jgi:hypothetical protein
MEYDSCLFEEALDAGVVDYIDVRQKQKEQEEEKKSFIEKQKAGADEDGEGEPAASEGLSTSRKWDEIKPKSFKSKKVQFVVCLNKEQFFQKFYFEDLLLARTVNSPLKRLNLLSALSATSPLSGRRLSTTTWSKTFSSA